MSPLAALFATAGLMLISGMAIARNITSDEAAKLQAVGAIQSTAQLNAAALSTHPHATITDTELDEEYGKHIYQVDLTDAQGIMWNVDVDAGTGKILKNHQDR